MVKSRPPLLGYNHNVRHAGRLYHVQTEDSGTGRATLTTHVFFSGAILHTARSAYDPGDEETAVLRRMQLQHKEALKLLRASTFDDKLRGYLKDHPEPPVPEAAVPEGAGPADEPGPAVLSDEALAAVCAGAGGPAPPERIEGEVSLRLMLERLDAPGAAVATTAPYNLTDFAKVQTQPRGLTALVPPEAADPELADLLDLQVVSADLAEQPLAHSGYSGIIDGDGDGDGGSEQVLELEAEPPGAEELELMRAELPSMPPAALPAPPAGPAEPPRPAEPQPPPAMAARPPSQRTPQHIRRSARSARSGRQKVSVGPGGVVIVPPLPVAGTPAPASAAPSQDADELPAEETQVRGSRPRQSEPGEPNAPARPLAARALPGPGRRTGAVPFRPRPTAEGVVLQRPMYVSEKKPPKLVTDTRLPLAIDERSLDQVILAYLAEDVDKNKK